MYAVTEVKGSSMWSWGMGGSSQDWWGGECSSSTATSSGVMLSPLRCWECCPGFNGTCPLGAGWLDTGCCVGADHLWSSCPCREKCSTYLPAPCQGRGAEPAATAPQDAAGPGGANRHPRLLLLLLLPIIHLLLAPPAPEALPDVLQISFLPGRGTPWRGPREPGEPRGPAGASPLSRGPAAVHHARDLQPREGQTETEECEIFPPKNQRAPGRGAWRGT